jgi:hypothetical protein
VKTGRTSTPPLAAQGARAAHNMYCMVSLHRGKDAEQDRSPQ